MLKMPLVSFHFILPPFKDNDRFLRNKNWFAITFLPLLKTHLRHLLLPRIHFSNYVHYIKHTLYKKNVENVHSTLLREEKFNSDTIILNNWRVITSR